MQAEKIQAMQLLREAARRGQSRDAMRALARAAGNGALPDLAAIAASLAALVRLERRWVLPRVSRRASAERRRAPVPLPRVPYQLSLLPNSLA